MKIGKQVKVAIIGASAVVIGALITTYKFTGLADRSVPPYYSKTLNDTITSEVVNKHESSNEPVNTEARNTVDVTGDEIELSSGDLDQTNSGSQQSSSNSVSVKGNNIEINTGNVSQENK